MRKTSKGCISWKGENKKLLFVDDTIILKSQKVCTGDLLELRSEFSNLLKPTPYVNTNFNYLY